MGGILGNEAWRRSNGGLWLPRVFGMPETVYGWCCCSGGVVPPDVSLSCCPILQQEWPTQLQAGLSGVVLTNITGSSCETCADIPSSVVVDMVPECGTAGLEIQWWYIEKNVCTGRRIPRNTPPPPYDFPMDMLVYFGVGCGVDENYKPAINVVLALMLATNTVPGSDCAPKSRFCFEDALYPDTWYQVLMSLTWKNVFPIGRNSNGVYDKNNPYYKNCYLDIVDPDSLPTYWREDHPEIPLGCFPLYFVPQLTPNIGGNDGRLACQYLPYGVALSCDGTSPQPDPVLVCEV